MMVFSNAFYGFPFAQYILKAERVYMAEKCNATQIEENILCEEAKEALGRIWTVGVMVASAGPVIFGIIQPKIGLCFTRIICGTSTTLGLLMMSFYHSNVNFLFWGSLLLALPAISYIVLNTVIAPVYKRITVILIVIIPGLVNSSATCLLIAKKLWQHDHDLQLDMILFYLAIASMLIHVRTIFLMPYTPVPQNVDGYSIFEHSMFSHFVLKKKSGSEKLDEKPKSQNIPLSRYWPILRKLTYWQYLFYYTILTFRINTIRGWMYMWIDWAFSSIRDECSGDTECEQEVQVQVSTLLDLNGFSYFALAVIPIVPAMVIKFIGVWFKSPVSGKVYGLVGLMAYCIVFSIVNSMQMCKNASDIDETANTVALILISVSIVPLHYSTPCVFLTTFFPMELFPFLYGIMKIPSIILMVVNDPLNSIIIQDSVSDYQFCPVSIGLAVATGTTIVCVFYTFFRGRDLIKESEKAETIASEEETKPIVN